VNRCQQQSLIPPAAIRNSLRLMLVRTFLYCISFAHTDSTTDMSIASGRPKRKRSSKMDAILKAEAAPVEDILVVTVKPTNRDEHSNKGAAEEDSYSNTKLSDSDMTFNAEHELEPDLEAEMTIKQLCKLVKKGTKLAINCTFWPVLFQIKMLIFSKILCSLSQMAQSLRISVLKFVLSQTHRSLLSWIYSILPLAALRVLSNRSSCIS
jgi:hypothetical protein